MSDCTPLRPGDNDLSPSRSGSQSSQQFNGDNRDSQNQNDSLSIHNHPVRRPRTPSESSSSNGQIRYGAKNVIELFIPVSICMIIVVGTMKATDSYQYSSHKVIWYAQMMFTDQSVDTGTRVWQSFANAMIMLVLIIVMTTILILLYKFRCYTPIHGWLILSSLMLLFMFTVMYLAEILKVYNIPIDDYTLMIIMWNFGIVGMICIHWKGPLLLQQGYLIAIAALLALVFIRSLPDWTTWTVLAIVSVWDLIAVLCPRGPLRILVETAQERNEAIFPALIYSSTMVWEAVTSISVSVFALATMTDNPGGTSSGSTSSGSHSQSRLNRPNKPSSSPSNRQVRRVQRGEMKTTIKREQHPVEIHYEDEVEPPEITYLQPDISGISRGDEWTRPIIRASHSRDQHDDGQPELLRPRPQQSSRPFTRPAETISHSQETRSSEPSLEEERGVKLGLGDFIFFSLLVGKASSYDDWTITVSCYVAILVGLCLTLSLLAIFKKALPALPISIAFGLSAFFLSYVFVVPFAGSLAINQVFV